MLTANELFLLMLNLSQVNDAREIKRIYIEALNSTCTGLHLSLMEVDNIFNDYESEIIEVATSKNSFGYIVIEGDLNNYSMEDQALIRNSVMLLAIILENREQSQLLEMQNVNLQETAKEKQIMIEKIAKTAPLFLYVYDIRKRKNIFANNELLKFLGYETPASEKTGDIDFLASLHREDSNGVALHIEEIVLLDFNDTKEIEYRLKKHDGSEHWFLSIDTPYQKDADGNTVKIIGSAIEITERKRSTNKLKDMLREKEILLKEVHHRVKNNMQIISSLLYLQMSTIKDEKIRALFKDSQNRIYSMASVHEHIYRSENLSSINISDFIYEFSQEIIHSSQVSENILVKVDVEDINISIEIAIPVSLILNELITNAVKHAFKSDAEGTVYISLYAGEDGNYHLTVQDNGCGLPETFRINCDKSLGMQIVNSLTRQLDGSLVFKNNRGACFHISFPVK